MLSFSLDLVWHDSIARCWGRWGRGARGKGGAIYEQRLRLPVEMEEAERCWYANVWLTDCGAMGNAFGVDRIEFVLKSQQLSITVNARIQPTSRPKVRHKKNTARSKIGIVCLKKKRNERK